MRIGDLGKRLSIACGTLLWPVQSAIADVSPGPYPAEPANLVKTEVVIGVAFAIVVLLVIVFARLAISGKRHGEGSPPGGPDDAAPGL